jgi:teichuronic acid biosynthesis glycosyltransferase TuaG
MVKESKQPLVSIVVPVYNAARFMDDTIQTVLNQTYQNWELLLVDDCSSDDSVQIIQKYLKKEKRIKLFKLSENSGAAIARNTGIDKAKGHYLAFLDADDLWMNNKLELQVAFMQEKNAAFSFTGYEFADENGKPNGKKVHVPETITYKQALKNTTIGTSTVMLDMSLLTKKTVHMPNLKRGQDTATWWKILKTINFACGIDKNLAFYRRTNSSLSANKITALKRTWNIYRNIEKLSYIYSFYCFSAYTMNAIKRRI